VKSPSRRGRASVDGGSGVVRHGERQGDGSYGGGGGGDVERTGGGEPRPRTTGGGGGGNTREGCGVRGAKTQRRRWAAHVPGGRRSRRYGLAAASVAMVGRRQLRGRQRR
jgi:hypothetical protein